MRYDSRLKRLSRKQEFVLINNYKCGFSSSNLLESREVSSISDSDCVILFYRNIFLRTSSIFINWCIADDRFKNGKGWLLTNLRKSLPETEYEYFVDLLSRGAFQSAFTAYTGALEGIYQKNDHTLPQTRLVNYYNIRKIDHFVELENCGQFERITGIAFPYDRTNRSNEVLKSRVLRTLKEDETLQNRLRRIYRSDIDFFAGHGLSVDDI